jgi:hypothetical protein
MFYELPKKEIESVRNKVQVGELKFKKPQRVDISKSEIERINKLNKYSLILSNGKDKMQIAIDEKEEVIYGWY